MPMSSVPSNNRGHLTDAVAAALPCQGMLVETGSIVMLMASFPPLAAQLQTCQRGGYGSHPVASLLPLERQVSDYW